MSGYGPLANERRYQPVEPAGDEIDQLDRLRRSLPPSSVPAWAEVPASLASGALSSVVGGLAGLGTIPLRAMGVPGASPAEVVQSIQQAGTYLPRSIEGMGGLYGAGQAFNALHAPVARAADLTLGATGSPALATAVDIGPTAVGALLGLPGAAGRGALGAARSVVPEIAASRPRLGPGIRGQQGSFLRSQQVVGSEDLGRAMAMADAGRPVDEIWHRMNVWPPTKDLSQPQPPQGIALSEIPDTVRNATPANLARPDLKQQGSLLDLMKQYDAWMQYGYLLQTGVPKAQALQMVSHLPGGRAINPNMPYVPTAILNKANMAQAQLEDLQLPKYANTLGDAIDHPALFSAMPKLRDVKLGVLKHAPFHAQYNPSKGLITLAGQLSPEDTPKAVIHETNHAIQDFSGLPFGTSPKDAHNALTNAYVQGLIPKELFDKLMPMSPDDVYYRAWGEGLSNAAANRLDLSPTERRIRPPWEFFRDIKGRDIPANQLWVPHR